jgi:hypothetical protein
MERRLLCPGHLLVLGEVEVAVRQHAFRGHRVVASVGDALVKAVVDAYAPVLARTAATSDRRLAAAARLLLILPILEAQAEAATGIPADRLEARCGVTMDPGLLADRRAARSWRAAS